jgi:hypothetical protein
MIRFAMLLPLLALFSMTSQAECICTCVSGQVKALCRSSLDIPPICAPQICPIVPPSVQPIAPPTIPPLGTSQCEPKQVFNPATGQYEWRRVCH